MKESEEGEEICQPDHHQEAAVTLRLTTSFA